MRIYCIDTSSLINLKRWCPSFRKHPVWQRLKELIREDRLIAPHAVLEELEKQDDQLTRWAKAHGSMFKQHTDEHVRLVQRVLKKFPGWVDANDPGAVADPFVVALAYYESYQTTLGQSCIVVTEEVFNPGKTRIPNVCQEYKLTYRTVHQMFSDEGWTI